MRGRSKARFFRRFGFTLEHWQDFADALLVHGRTHEVAGVEEGSHGLLYRVEGIIETPDGRNPYIRTVWQIDYGDDHPRLISAYRIGG